MPAGAGQPCPAGKDRACPGVRAGIAPAQMAFAALAAALLCYPLSTLLVGRRPLASPTVARSRFHPRQNRAPAWGARAKKRPRGAVRLPGLRP
ncbi:hypothetical protein L538_0430 [Bordetella hinzii 4161]|nr:hypothetical protein L538_0430 [Bordetella hinzii 4161]